MRMGRAKRFDSARPVLRNGPEAMREGCTMPQDLPPPPDIPEGLEHLLPQFIAEMGKDAAQLADLAAAPLADLGEHAHAMRGKAGLFGESRLYEILTVVEQLALAGDGSRMADLIAQVIERSNQLALYGPIAAAEPS